MQRSQDGLVFKAHRLLDHSTLGLRVIKTKKRSRTIGRKGGGGGRACLMPPSMTWGKGTRGLLGTRGVDHHYFPQVVNLQVYIYVQTPQYIYAVIHVYVYVYIHIYLHTSIFTYMYIYVYIYIYIYVYTYIFRMRSRTIGRKGGGGGRACLMAPSMTWGIYIQTP